jgi:putative spermidine/putrescine transport system permease protein
MAVDARSTPSISAGRALAGRGGFAWSSALLVLPAALAMLLFFVIPVLQTIRVSLWTSVGFTLERSVTFTQYSQMLQDPIFWDTVTNTLRSTTIVVLGALLIAFPVAYCITYIVPDRWRIPVFFLAIIPFWTSYLIRMVAHVPILGRQGLFNTVLLQAGIIQEPLDILLYTETSQLLVMILLYALFGVGPIVFSLSRIEPSLLEASATLGARPMKTFFRVTLPMARPGIMMGGLFISILAMQEFATPLIIGGGQWPLLGNDVMARASLLQWPPAAARAVILTLMTLLVVGILVRLSKIHKEV